MSILTKIKSAIFGPQIDYKQLINDGAVIVDVRTPGEYKSGHVKGSKNMPLQSFSQKMDQLAGKKVILVCRSGARAGQAKNMLRSCGVEAYNAGPWQRINQIKN